MEWWQAILLGIVQGLTEFLPVSSSAHLMIFRELLGVDAEGFLDFTVSVHFATVLSTLVVFWGSICSLLKGFFKFRYNDETDYICKLLVSMVPVALVGLFFKDAVEAMFADNLRTVAVCLVITSLLLLCSDLFGRLGAKAVPVKQHRNGISYLQAFVVGIGQACAVAPGLSRSGTTISAGLLSGVNRDRIAKFSFLMVLVPIVGEQCLTILESFTSEETLSSGIGLLPLLIGALSAFIAGLFACKAMIALVKKARLSWFALYCFVLAMLIFVFA